MSNDLAIVAQAAGLEGYVPSEELTPKQEAFCVYWIRYKNATRACRLAGYAESSLRSQGSDNLANPNIMARIKDLTYEMSQRTYVDAEKITRHLAMLAFSDVGDYYDEEGKLIPLHELTEEQRFAIKGLKVTSLGEGQSETHYEIADKKASLETLGRSIGLFNKDDSNKTQVVIFNFDRDDEGL